MSIAANRHREIRAALCSDPYTARTSRLHNDANVLCLGARVIGAGLAEEIVEAFLTTSFEGGRHAGRVTKLNASS
jgi:ribose 5-phosphate isomerase B